jgi:hypothetical protein
MDANAMMTRYATIDRGWKACLWASALVGAELLRVAV